MFNIGQLILKAYLIQTSIQPYYLLYIENLFKKKNMHRFFTFKILK